MSESKHTPGPWRVDPAANCDIQTSDGSFEIATTHPGFLSRGKADPGRAQANARLIAAAPDLLAQLQALYRAYIQTLEAGRERMIDLGGVCDPVYSIEASDPALAAARAAIARATGAA